MLCALACSAELMLLLSWVKATGRGSEDNEEVNKTDTPCPAAFELVLKLHMKLTYSTDFEVKDYFTDFKHMKSK